MSVSPPSKDDGHWHLDKRVQIPHIVTTLVAAAGFALYLGAIKSDIEVLKAQGSAEMASQHARDDRQDKSFGDSLAQIQATIQRVDSKLDRIVERTPK